MLRIAIQKPFPPGSLVSDWESAHHLFEPKIHICQADSKVQPQTLAITAPLRIQLANETFRCLLLGPWSNDLPEANSM